MSGHYIFSILHQIFKLISMRNLFRILLIFVSLLLLGCEDVFNNDDSEKNSSLYVKFLNESSSEYTITNVQVRNRGKVDNYEPITTVWSSNLLKSGEKIAPGTYKFFTLEIPSGEWAEYQLGVDTGNGVEIMLYEQENYGGFTDLPITHWGGDERTVSATITFDDLTQTIAVTGWSDWVGIE